ncbi:MAG: hypothetical protein GX410_10895 [Elusimicrobia bacterium]|nr:hypothetical protein [Elusimicrobiota bacterium]
MKRMLCAAVLVLACQTARAEQEVTSKYKVSFYGHIKNDVSYDTRKTAGDDYMMYVTSNKPGDSVFRESARASRIGFNISDGGDLTAKVEADFLGLSESVGGTPGATTDLRLRHAYVNLKHGDWNFLAGQTWMLTPLELPGSNNELLMGYSGALWYRAPQVRATWQAAENLTVAAAAVRPTRKLTDAEGTSSGLPSMQGQAQLKIGKAKLTLAGAWGRWKNTTTDQEGDVNLVDLGYNVPLTEQLTLNGQIWTGRNLYDFLGGIGNMGYDGDEVRASGGFANLLVKPWQKVFFNAAWGIDDPKDSDLAVGSRSQNTTLMGNVNYQLMDTLLLTMETSYMVTQYKTATGFSDYGDMHYQFSCKYVF